MSENAFSRMGMGYVLRADPIFTELRAGHLKRSSGELHGELAIRTKLPDVKTVDGLLHQARFNFSSTTTRDRLSKVLKQRTPNIDVDWFGLLEEFCQHVLEAEVAGEPFIEIGTRRMERSAANYALDPLVPLGVAALLYGPGGAGKSLIALTGCVSVAAGREVLPGIAPALKGPALYLDWETDAHVVNERVLAIAAGHGFEPPTLTYRRCRRPLADDAEDLAAMVERRGIVYMVIDSAGMAMGTGGEYGDANESTLRLFEAIRHINISTLIVDHVSKSELRSRGKVRGLLPYGSIYKINLSRSAWELRGEDEDESGDIRVGLINTKVNDARLHAPIGLRIDWDPERIHFSEDEYSESYTGGGTLTEQVLEILADGQALTVPQMSRYLGGADAATLRVTMKRLKDKGLAVSDEETKAWRLTGAAA